MTNRAERDKAMNEAVRPFRMAVSSLSSPIQAISGDLWNMESSISNLFVRPSIIDFSPFDALSSESSMEAARLESQPIRPDAQQKVTLDLNRVSREKTPPVFSLRRAVPSSRVEPSRDGLTTGEINRARREPGTNARGLLESLTDSLLPQKHQASGNPSGSRDAHRTRMNQEASGSVENESEQRRLSGNSFDAGTNDYPSNPLEAMADRFILDNRLSDPMESGDDMVEMFLKGVR
jgi:hypothetical protein